MMARGAAKFSSGRASLSSDEPARRGKRRAGSEEPPRDEPVPWRRGNQRRRPASSRKIAGQIATLARERRARGRHEVEEADVARVVAVAQALARARRREDRRVRLEAGLGELVELM